MKIAFAQLNHIIGDFASNAEKILAAYRDGVASGADLVVAPELAIPGYPPRDLLFRSRFVRRNLEVLAEIAAEVGEVPLALGYADVNDKGIRTAAAQRRRRAAPGGRRQGLEVAPPDLRCLRRGALL
ncbi:MAG: nitrilase-related carbon-nitrogen hydrolase [Verrucomicrobiales bacterium]